MKLMPWLALAIFVIAAGEAGATDSTDTIHRSAVEAARAGRVHEALSTLRSLQEKFPENREILGDYVVVAGWNGEHSAALALLDKVNLATAPAYVIESLANSARRLQRYELAESLYQKAQQRFPERIEPQIGLALTLADAGKPDAATSMLEVLRTRHPNRSDVLLATAEVATARHDDFGALATYQTLLALEPTQRAALRGKIQTMARLGTPQLALDLADRNPGVLDASEREAIAADITAHRIRWGAIAADSGRGSARFAELDLALADSEAAAARALDPNAALSAVERQLVLDRISALRERYRMHDVIALHQAMAARPAALPAYVKSAAASAYLYLEQPETARDLYREAVSAAPDNLESRIGLFYALAECEEHDAALQEIEHAVAITPQWIDAWSAATIRENPDYSRVLAARAMAPLFANRPGEAEQRLSDLSTRMPYDMDIGTDYASSMRARGWPRAAEHKLRWILAVDPDNSGALGERAGALLEMHDYQNAKYALAAAQAVSAENGRVLRAGRLLQVHQMRELVIDGTFGRSAGGPSGTRDHSLDAKLYSSPLAENYRVFAHAYNAQAKFATGTGRIERAGLGLEYRSRWMTATGELAHGVGEGVTAASAALAFTPNDRWTLRGEADSFATQIPLQAALAGIHAGRAMGEVVWRDSESRSAALSFERMNFSDGNRRNMTQARWTERVIAGPVYKLEITGSLYASRNSLAGAPYFNPGRDFSPTLEFANEWLQWRRYTRAFRHRLVLTAGSYRQQGFGTGSAYGVRYEQEWAADDRLTLRYGIGRSRHPYDGVQSTRDYGYFNVNWRF